MNEEILILIAGAVAPFIIQGIKAAYKGATGAEMPGIAALNLTYVVAVLFAFAGRVVAGEFIVPDGELADVVPLLVTQIGAVLAVATFIYKSLIKPPA